MKAFADQVAIITGAGQGIGFEIAKHLALAGAKIILNDIDEKLALKASEKIRHEGGQCLAAPGDCSQMPVIRAMIDFAKKEFGKLDIAIANAGITLFGDFLDYPEESLRRVMEVNMSGSFFLAQQAAIEMKANGKGGSILFTSSVTGHQAHKNLAAYGMTKAALEMLARHLVVELSPFGINVNTIAPGATLTERTINDPEYEKTWSRITPTGRPATTADIAHAALFLVSKQARQITGQSLIIDGGWTSVSPSPY
ncbi:MAG: short-chain dehydrogenase [Bacteroidetes bacterium]|nr:MAG: short-chain dehydrogenase [Bacteroidota bacterium]